MLSDQTFQVSLGIRALRALACSVQDTGVDHAGSHIVMAQQFLDSSNIIAASEQVSGEGMPEGVAAREV